MAQPLKTHYSAQAQGHGLCLGFSSHKVVTGCHQGTEVRVGVTAVSTVPWQEVDGQPSSEGAQEGLVEEISDTVVPRWSPGGAASIPDLKEQILEPELRMTTWRTEQSPELEPLHWQPGRKASRDKLPALAPLPGLPVTW